MLLIGSNPRVEAAVLNARIRKAWRASGMPIGVIGEGGEMRYAMSTLVQASTHCKSWLTAKGKFASVLKKAKNPLIIIGQGALARADGAAVLGLAAKLAVGLKAVREDWSGFRRTAYRRFACWCTGHWLCAGRRRQKCFRHVGRNGRVFPGWC